MRIKSILRWLVLLAFFLSASIHADERPQAANGAAETNPEAKARADFEAAERAAREAEAALGPLRDAMRTADAAYAEASKVARDARQKATEAKNLAGEQGVQELEQAEAAVPAAIQALTQATEAKPPLDKALEEARAIATPLQEAYDAAEKVAKEAEGAARVASEAANRLEDEAKSAADQAVALRRAADAAQAALARAQQNEQRAADQANAAPQKLADAETQKKAADEALANARSQVAAAEAAYQAAEQGVQADEARAVLAQAQAALQQLQKPVTVAAQALARATAQKRMADAALAGAKNQVATATTAAQAAEQAAQAAELAAEEKKQAVAQADAKRKAAADAQAAVAQAQQGEQQAAAAAAAAAQKAAEAQAEKKSADDALASAKEQVVAATAAAEAAQQAAQDAEARAKHVAEDAEQSDDAKKQAADEAVAKRQAADEARTALAQAQQREQAAQAPATNAAQKLTEAETQKQAADQALANAKNQVAAATTANQAAQQAAKEIIQLDAASRQATAEAAAKRKVADEARAALTPAAQTRDQAANQANTAAQNLARAEARKKSADEELAKLRQRIAAAKETHEADEQAAKQAEAAAVPLREEAERTRAAYTAAMAVANEKRTLAQHAKAALYRLVASGQVAGIMESPDPPKPTNRIDEIILAKLKTLEIEPALCSDAVFIRRAYLDLIGKLPPAEEARAFLQDPDPGKRAALIDRLLDRSEHADYWSMRWSDILRIKAEFPVTLWPNAAQAYHRWVWESIAQNKPYDQFARELLTSSGSNFRVGPVNFYRAVQEETPEALAAAVALAFMGSRIHLWPEEISAGTAVFFSQVGYKPTSEWKEEIVFWDPLNSVAVPGSIAPGIDAVAKSVAATNRIPQGLAEPLRMNEPLDAIFPDGTKVTVPADRDPRKVFADWLIQPENPWFARAIANRIWGWAMGRGVVHEPDDFREGNPPSNPELLDYLAEELVSSGWDLKHLKRQIFTSTAYQFSSIPRVDHPEAEAHFASYPLRRLEAEVLIDALNDITGSSDLYTSAVPEPFTYIPEDMPAVALADGSITSSFLALFGRSGRDTGLEAERISELSTPQWLHMLNSATIQSKLQNGPRLAAMLSSGGSNQEITERLYLTVLSRFPTEADVQAAEEHAKTGVAKGRDVWIDLAWALINSPEFLLRH
jgi:hypothetical protein